MALLYAEQVEYMDLDEMQETHDEEIAILNEVDKLATYYMMDKTKAKLAALETKLDEYLVHVKAHFANEERLMNKYDFPAYEMHKMAHDIFLMDVSIAMKQWKHTGDIDKVIRFIRNSPEWIVMHINTVDAPTSVYLSRKMAEEADKNQG